MSSDGELICQLRERDLSALGELFERYRHQVYRIALAIVRNPQVAEDILQDCFLKLHIYAHRIDPERPLMPWLYRVTANLSYTFVSRHLRRSADLDQVSEQLSVSGTLAPDRITERKELNSDIRHAIEGLSDNQRVVVILHYLANMSIQDISEVLDCPVGTVKSRLHYARENLRHQLSSMDRIPELAHGYA
ncbi:MAG: RNA polymerase sigma factor [Anaerolineales bacterium]|nr:RNA polymerase sigma factor [Anaerolineales bacterium]